MTWGPAPWTGLTPARPQATPARPDITLARAPAAGQTPAQAYGHPDFVTDVPVQGPTDPGMRAGSCWWAQNRLPAQPHCVDCQEKGNVMVPGWSRSSMACPGCGMLGEAVSFGGGRARGFALGGPSDPAVTLVAAQNAWVAQALTTLNGKILQASGTTCPTWADPATNLSAAVGCFQAWYNANYAPPKAPGVTLRTDGVLDLDTLSALQMIAGMHPADFPTAYPATPAPLANPPVANPTAPAAPAAPAAATPSKGLSTGEMVGIGLGGAALLGGIVYAATRGGGGGGRRRRR